MTIEAKKLFAPQNRGILLDAIVFVVNLVLMFVLANLFSQLAGAANSNDTFARIGIILFCLALAFLQPVAALLKRHRAHERNPELDRPSPRFLFNPFFYFLSKLLFLIAAASLTVDWLYGDQISSAPSADYFGLPAWLFTVLFLGVPLLAIVNTAFVYFYFWKPKRRAFLKFLEYPQAETIADVFLFVNMILYQVFWAFLMRDLPHDIPSVAGRLSQFAFTALLIYFPPRLFYLAEDGRRPLTWAMMFLANLPILVRLFF